MPSPAHATLVLIGDPKQAIYAFRGGDVVTYLAAAGTAATRRTLATNWRSDAALVDALQVADPRRRARRPADHGPRRRGAPPRQPAGRRAGPARRSGCVRSGRRDFADRPRRHGPHRRAARAHRRGPRRRRGAAARLRRDVRRASRSAPATSRCSSPASSGSSRSGRRCSPTASRRWSGGGSSVMLSQAADEWLALLEALEQQRTGRVRAVALTSFVGETPQRSTPAVTRSPTGVGRAGPELARPVPHPRRRRGARGGRGRRPAGPGARAARRRAAADRPRPPRPAAPRDRAPRAARAARRCSSGSAPSAASAVASTERTRRLDTDAAAVQILTIHGSKGLQYPVVYLPALLRLLRPRRRPSCSTTTTTAPDGSTSPGRPSAARRARAEDAGEELRLTYVALTRAQSQVVTWWGPEPERRPLRPQPAAVRPHAGAGRRCPTGCRCPPTTRRWPRSRPGRTPARSRSRRRRRRRGAGARRTRRRRRRSTSAGSCARSTPTGGARRTPG